MEFTVLNYKVNLEIDNTIEKVCLPKLGIMPNLLMDIPFTLEGNRIITEDILQLRCNTEFLELPQSLKDIAYLHEVGHYERRNITDPFEYLFNYTYRTIEEILADEFAIKYGKKIDLIRLLKYLFLFFEANNNEYGMDSILTRLESLRNK